MTITFYSNYLNHHQIPFCKAMREILGDGFIFVETEPMEAERQNLGWGLKENYDYCLKSYESDENYEKSLFLAVESDIIIHGSAPEIYISNRIKTGKPAFRYSERLFKRGFWRILHPRAAMIFFWRHTRLRYYPIYMLCAGAYTEKDCKRIFSYPNKCFNWGYFPEVKRHEIDKLFELKSNNPIKILWVGRFLDWKRPQDALEVAKRLKSKNIDFTLDFIGCGEELKNIQNTAANIDAKINFLGAMKPDEVRSHMEQADIFLFTSNYQEGWGAVLNEAMNSGCAIVSCRAPGAAPFLLSHGVNGFMYDLGNVSAMCNCAEQLALNPQLRRNLGSAALNTVSELWNPVVAAQRLVAICHAITSRCPPPVFTSGPLGR